MTPGTVPQSVLEPPFGTLRTMTVLLIADRQKAVLAGARPDRQTARPAVTAECRTGTVISPSVMGSMRELYGFELEPEVRDWLDGLSDSDHKHVDEVCALLAEKGSELGGPVVGPPGRIRVGAAAPASRCCGPGHVLVYC
jgi:hypothetical protein